MNKNFFIPIVERKPSFLQGFKDGLMTKKLGSILIMSAIVLVSSVIAFLMTKNGIIPGAMAMAAMIAIPAVYAIVAFPRFGLIVFLTFAYIIMWFFKLGINFPLGTLMDGMEVLFFLSIFITQKKEMKDWSIYWGPVTFMILVWFSYIVLEFFNPDAASREAWMYTSRSIAIVMFMYFVFVYYIDSVKYIRLIFKLWLGLAAFGAVYAFKQEHIGFFPFEEAFLHSDPNVELLLFIGGVWRKFSIFSDPVAFAYNMVTASLLCIGVMTGPVTRLKRMLLFGLMMFLLIAMLYSGTRGAYVLLPAALALLTVLKYSRKVILMVLAVGGLLVGLIFMPTSNNTLYRFQSAFKPSDDASFNLRKMNQKRIQPFIQTHPLGGGMGSCGEWGLRFSPNTYLAHFPPDSGYVRVAVELGWVGLLVFCTFMFTILYMGINNYYKIRDPELKSYCLAATLIIFALNVGNYPQEALVQFPTNVYFYLVIAIITVTRRLDDQKNKQLKAS